MRAAARRRAARGWHVLMGMRKPPSWVTRIVLAAAATSGVVAACYNDVPGPSGPLPPTREVSPQGPQPGPITPTPLLAIDAGIETTSRVIEMNTRIVPQAQEAEDPTPPTTPNPPMQDAGVSDSMDLPPVPDADVLPDAPPGVSQ